MSISKLLMVALVALTFLLVPGVAQAETNTFVATDDAWVKDSAPNKNHGAAATLQVCNGGRTCVKAGDPASVMRRSFVKFKPTGMSGRIDKATLRVQVTDPSVDGPALRHVPDDSWSEGNLTYANQPAVDATRLGSSGATTDSEIVAYDVTSAVRAEGLNGDYSFRFAQTNSDLSVFASKENAGNYIKPRLVIETTPPADTTAPNTSVGTVTQSDAGGRDASIPFSGTDNVGVTGFECRLDGAAYTACTSPKTVDDLAVGSHTFDVRARDAAGNVDPSPASVTFTVSQPPAPGTFPGIRWYPVMGVYAGADQGWVHDANIVDQQFADYVGAANENNYLDLDRDGERYWFCGGRKITWKDALVNEKLAPTGRAQAQNPNWSNYKWNQPGEDVITEQLEASNTIAANKSKLCIFVATTATSVQNPVPAYMLNHPNNLAWTDGQGKDHVRFDKQEAVDHTADFLIALTKKYGKDPRVGSITHGEYYTNPDGGGLPRDLDYDAFRANAKSLWSQVIAATPADANGNRVNFVQSQPIASGGLVTNGDIARIGVGISGSGAHLFGDAAQDDTRLALYGKVPTHHQVNTGPLGDSATWDGTPNPFGFGKGQKAPIRYEHLAWYFGSKGVAPLDSLMMRDDNRYVEQWHETYRQFGPNGSKVGQWGQIPHYPPAP